MNAYLLNVGLETLHLRMPQHCANALAVAKFVPEAPQDRLGQLPRSGGGQIP